MFAQARSNDSFSISVMTISMYLLSIVASHLCISKEFGLYYQHLSPYLFDSTGNLESARGLKKRRWGSGKTEQLEADGDSWCVTISFSEVDGWMCTSMCMG